MSPELDPFVDLMHEKGRQTQPLAAATTALMVVDMQRYFTQPGYPFTDVFQKLRPGSADAYLGRVRSVVIPSIQQLLRCFRAAGAPIVYTAVGSETGDGRDLPCWLRAFDELGLGVLGERIWPPVDDPSWEIDEALAPRRGERVLNKLSTGTFATTGLDHRLRRQGVESVVVTGVATDVCVSTTAREAADRDYKTVVVSDACATLSDALHTANLESLRSFGDVRTAADVVKELTP